jgi:hypothetical protein
MERNREGRWCGLSCKAQGEKKKKVFGSFGRLREEDCKGHVRSGLRRRMAWRRWPRNGPEGARKSPEKARKEPRTCQEWPGNGPRGDLQFAVCGRGRAYGLFKERWPAAEENRRRPLCVGRRGGRRSFTWRWAARGPDSAEEKTGSSTYTSVWGVFGLLAGNREFVTCLVFWSCESGKNLEIFPVDWNGMFEVRIE